MKKAFLILGLVAVSAAAGGLTAWTVSADRGGSVAYIEREVERTPALGTQFTSYQAEQYPDLTYAAENAVKAVVNIEAIQQVEMPQRRGYDPFLEFFGIPQDYGRGDGGPQYREQRAGGSGVIISEDGYIVTNNHVVDGASKLKVKLNDGRTFEAKLIGKDSATDLALLKIEAADLPTVPFGSSDALRLGEWVLAIGSPFDLQSTITAGIVSAKARNLGVIPNDFSIEAFIQTDAAVNPGNSGGALVNTHGELVGINTLIKSQTGSYVGYSFAIPESIVRKVVVDLKEYGIVQRALLGIRYGIVDQDFIDNMGEETGIKELGGAYVSSVVEGGSASEAGIRKGDVILDIDGVKINDNATLSEQIGRRRPNDKVKLSVKRDGKVKQIDVTLRNKAGKTELITKEDVDMVEVLGGKFADAGAKLCRELDIKGGVQVVGIKADGILARARVKQGFVITHINDRPVYSLSDMERMTDKVRSIDGIYPNGRAASYVLVE
jgi:serine protease Do